MTTPNNSKWVFENSSEQERREAIRSAFYLLSAFNGLDNAREYLSQVSESVGHRVPPLPDGRPQWVAITREQFVADIEGMCRQGSSTANQERDRSEKKGTRSDNN